MNKFNRKKRILELVLALGILASIIIQIILGRWPLYSQFVITEIIFWLDVILASCVFLSRPKTGVLGDERTIRVAEKAGLYAFLILVGCLILLSGAYILGGTNSFLLEARDSPWTPIIVAHIGLYSWAILAYYFVKKGE
ncbi:MAG: DUF2178 domain-containing protein [Candidatus Methanoperedens sp.]|nr:DUF2178 domain-containing protein [Candidatus Methanoperedens sp.]MCZ7403794.1 DUF2178 domain-containing protein [Candidatus Methanoperedens sp.]